MAVKTRPKRNGERTFLLDRTKSHRKSFSPLGPELVSSAAELHGALEHATKDSLWISYERVLTEALLRTLSWQEQFIGSGVFVHALSPETLPVLANCFKRYAFSSTGGFLPAEELAEALAAENRQDLFIGGNVDHASRTMTLWRGDLTSLTVPFSAFERSGDGTTPDFKRLACTDFGQTIRLGEYEAAADAILYEFDADYRRRISKLRRQSDQTFGASLRRLRKQRGLRREDFGPDVAAKTIARIEQGKVRRIQKRTREAIARRLRVKPEEIASY